MRVLFYKQVCYTHMCVNTVRTLPSNNSITPCVRYAVASRKNPYSLVKGMISFFDQGGGGRGRGVEGCCLKWCSPSVRFLLVF